MLMVSLAPVLDTIPQHALHDKYYTGNPGEATYYISLVSCVYIGYKNVL